jgi:hypothetical protein
MSRRCKPGQRARVIGEGWNQGAIVLVVGPHFPGEEWGGDGQWVAGLFPWKTISLSGLLRIQDADTLEPLAPSVYGVFEDEDLEPLEDGDDGPARSTGKDRPKHGDLIAGPSPVTLLSSTACQ